MNRPRQHAPALLYLLNLTSMDGGNAILMQGVHWPFSRVRSHMQGGAGGVDTSGYPINFL